MLNDNIFRRRFGGMGWDGSPDPPKGGSKFVLKSSALPSVGILGVLASGLKKARGFYQGFRFRASTFQGHLVDIAVSGIFHMDVHIYLFIAQQADDQLFASCRETKRGDGEIAPNVGGQKQGRFFIDVGVDQIGRAGFQRFG